MAPLSSPPGVWPDCFHGNKRVYDYTSPRNVYSQKRPKAIKSTPILKDYDQVYQHLLLAAAMVLGVHVDKLLALATCWPSASRNTSLDCIEISSDSGSNDHGDNDTPPGSSDSEKATSSDKTSPSRKPGKHSASIAASDLTSPHGQVGIHEIGDSLPSHGLDGMNTHLPIDLFAQAAPAHAYPTPPGSQTTYSASEVSDMFMSENIWHQSPMSDLSLSSYDTQATGHSATTLLPPTTDQTGLGNFTFTDCGVGIPFFVDQGYHGTEQQGYQHDPWNVPATTSIDLFAPETNDNQGLLHSAEEITELKPATKDGSAKGKRRGPFRVVEKRQETGLTRRLGACIRCSLQRIRCVPDPSSPSGCCQTCIVASPRRGWLPCLRYKITDAELLDHDVCPRPTWTSRWKKMELVDITTWDSSEIKTIDVTQGVFNTSYRLKVRQFTPVQGDALSRNWKIDGTPYTYECTPYAVADMREAGKVLIDFAQRTLPTAIRFWVDDQDQLLRDTYNMAYTYSLHAEREEDRSLLAATLRMWGASRMMSRAAHICGTETLGMRARDYGPKSASSNKILMPPVFSAQMEVIFVAMILQPTKKELLDRLKTLVHENNRGSWLAIYLCIFLLLHSCALLTARDQERATMQGVQQRFYRPRIIAELHNGAKILLAYFHFCNRGHYPLHMDWMSPDQVALAELKGEQVEFMRKTVKEFEMRSSRFRDILENNVYEDQYYFIAQLYEREWKPRHTV